MQRSRPHSLFSLIDKFQRLRSYKTTLLAIRLTLCLALVSQSLLSVLPSASAQQKTARVKEARPSVAVLAKPVSPTAQGNELKPVQIEPVAKTVVNFKQLSEQGRKKAQSRKGSRVENLQPIPAPMTIEELPETAAPDKPIDPLQLPSDTILGPNVPSPNPSTSFQGEFDEAVGGGPSGTFTVPPDTMGAVGVDKVVSYLNNNLVVHNKTTGARLSVVGHDAFWASTGATGLFDPRIQYDPYQNRFLIAAVSNAQNANSSIIVGFSNTSDPEGTYTLFRFIVGCGPGPGCAQGEWADFPMLGFNKNWIAVGVNQFTINTSAFVAGKMLVLDYPTLRTGTAVATIFNNASAATGFCMHPATTFSATEETIYVPTHQVSASALYRLHTITGTAAAPVFTVDATARTRPGGGWTQPGGDNLPQQCVPGVGAPTHTCPASPRGAEAGDAFIRSNVVFRNGLIWYAQSIALPAGGLTVTSRFAAQWTALNPDASFNTGGRVEDASAQIFNGGKHYSYPSIAVNKNNDVLLGFSEYESDDYIDAGYTFRAGSDAAGTMRDPVIYKEGEDYYQKTFSGARNRWGDYSHSVIDPVNDRDLWTVQQYSMLRVGGTNGQGSNDSRWGTWWAKVLVPTGVGDLMISEFRLYGPNGPGDEFIELYNVTGAALTVESADGSSGLGVAASDGTTRCVVPNGTVIPARGHYLCTNSVGYSLASYPAGAGPATGDAAYTIDIVPNAGLAIFNNSTGGGSYSLANRIDAVGSTSEANAIYKEGTGYPALSTAPASLLIDYSFYRKIDLTNGLPTDTNNNSSDLFFVEPNGFSAGAGQRLGAPGPENLGGPVQRNGTIKLSLIDPGCAGNGPVPPPTPNACARQRDLTAGSGNTSTLGTLSIRRKVTNFTGGFVTRLRFRVVDTTTFPPSAGIADLRLITSGTFTADLAGGGTTQIQGLTLEQDTTAPNVGQQFGGGFNSTVSAGTIALGTPLAPGASINVHFLLGVQQSGSFRFFINVEALP